MNILINVIYGNRKEQLQLTEVETMADNIGSFGWAVEWYCFCRRTSIHACCCQVHHACGASIDRAIQRTMQLRADAGCGIVRTSRGTV